MLDSIASNPIYLYSLSIVITVIALVFSTRYTMKILFDARDKTKKLDGKPGKSVEDEESERGNEGDDEAEDDVIPHSVDESANGKTGSGDSSLIDPVEYCEHIQSEVKKAKQRVTEKKFGQTLTPEQVQEEKEIQRQQLEAIFKMMQQQEQKFGVGSMEDVQNQMKLYV